MKGSWKKNRDCLIAAFHAMRERAIERKGVSGGMFRIRVSTTKFPGMASESPIPELVCEVLEEKLLDQEFNYEVCTSESETRTRAFTLHSAFLVESRLELMITAFRAVPEEDAYPIMNELANHAIMELLK